MFGADTHLVMDAMQMAGAAALAGAGAVYAIARLRNRRRKITRLETEKSDLEKRVQVLERIVTDRSQDLAEEIDALKRSEFDMKGRTA